MMPTVGAGLHEWLRDTALVALENIRPDRTSIEEQFGPKSPRYEQEVRELTTLYGQVASYETIRVKAQAVVRVAAHCHGRDSQQPG